MANAPHDALFRYTFGQVEHAAPLLRAILRPRVAAALDWRTMAPAPGTRIDGRLRRHANDLVFTVRAASSAVTVPVFVEHQSRSDHWTAFRVLDYAVGIWRQVLRTKTGVRRLPPIVPVVVHLGRRPWTAAMRFEDLLSGVGDDALFQQPRFRYVVQSLHGVSPGAVPGMRLSDLGALTLAALQHLPGAPPATVAQLFARWRRRLLRLLRVPSGDEAMAVLAEYALSTSRTGTDDLIAIAERHVSPRARKIMETAATKLRREGRKEGLVEGRVEGRFEGRAELLLAQLRARFGPLSPAIEARVASAGEEDSRRWALRLLSAKCLADVFAADPLP